MIGYWGMGGKDGVGKVWPMRGDVSVTFGPLNEEQMIQLKKHMYAVSAENTIDATG